MKEAAKQEDHAPPGIDCKTKAAKDQLSLKNSMRRVLLRFSLTACSGVCETASGIDGLASMHTAVPVASTEGKINGTRIHAAVRLNRDLSIARGSS